MYNKEQFFKDLLVLQDKSWVRANDIDNFVNALNLQDAEEIIGFLQQFKQLVREIPVEAFNDMDHRFNLLEAIQEALDIAIEKEEDELQ
ncbi:TyeA family type III secretion system gatekeeper subunit [Spartinivicinus poritis]|uniref:TyeA family type III secretion system gatekeeper subunit n=1 Tax=Spartinivicinus poritis TaxID=2994640 RepID=A0ABT5U3U3_9GAMM|nr:TyeA family type III secretion system gatekeeper subunit [Spartinivicinus sp. A2-2]MDE1460982.1 TyeA family type III secretion system gatekeeper subunit [Spartinivicinus sp. A2-2]